MEEVLKSVMALSGGEPGLIHEPRPLHLFSAARIENAFRFMQSDRNTGKIVITFKDRDIIPVR